MHKQETSTKIMGRTRRVAAFVAARAIMNAARKFRAGRSSWKCGHGMLKECDKRCDAGFRLSIPSVDLRDVVDFTFERCEAKADGDIGRRVDY
jgi:hypothetical protein